MMNMETEKEICPFGECIALNSTNSYLAQTCFLILAFLFLVGSKEGFTPLAVILYVIPPVIDLFGKKCMMGVLKIIKWILGGYSIIVVIISLLLMNGTLIETGTAYVMNESALIFTCISIPINLYAFSLILIVFVPVFLRLSVTEPKDNETIKTKYQKERKEKVK